MRWKTLVVIPFLSLTLMAQDWNIELNRETDSRRSQMNQDRRDLPVCALKKTDTHYVVSLGQEEITRIRHSNGKNITTFDSSKDLALFTALKAISSLRDNGACR